MAHWWMKLLTRVFAVTAVIALFTLAAFILVIAFNLSHLKAAVMTLVSVPFILLTILLVVDLLQSSQDNLLDRIYGVGGKTSSYAKFATLRRKRWRYHYQTDIGRNPRD